MEDTGNEVPKDQHTIDSSTVPSPLRTSRTKKIIIGFVLIVGIIGIGITGYVLNISKKPLQPPSTLISLPTPTSGQIREQKSNKERADNLIFSFVRNGNIYLYNKGKEELIIPAIKESTRENRNDNAYPFLSPNGKYIAYVEYDGGSDFTLEGKLNIYDVDTKKVRSTKYKTEYFHWNIFNQLEFETVKEVKNQDGEGIDTAASQITFLVLDPVSLAILASQSIGYEEREEGGIRRFPLFSDKKYIQFRNNNYYLVNRANNTESLLFNKEEIYQFDGWSPDGRYAIFLGAPQNDEMWISVDTDDSKLGKAKIIIPYAAGGAGGDLSTGLKWYFKQGFVAYCMESIFFIDNKEPLELTHSGGGGCHNEEGFVATSPNGEFAFVKFDDRFEIHTKSGEKKIINETIPLRKTRRTPKNLVWLDNDHMIIFENTFGSSENSNEPKIFLFTRETNTVEPLVENGYLSTFFAGVP